MKEDKKDCEALCLKIIYLLEQDPVDLSRSLKGDVLDGYKKIVHAETTKMQEVRKLLKHALEP